MEKEKVDANQLAIQRLRKGDLSRFIELIRLFENVFERQDSSMPDPNYLQRLIGREDILVFVAIIENRVVGGLTAYVLEQYYSEKPLAYIYDLAVDAQWQRQGVGKQLIAAINRYCKEKGFEEMYVQVEKADDHAVDFYRKTHPATEEQVVHFSYSLGK